MSARQAAFLDRDGVLNELVLDPASGLHESPLHPDEVSLLPGAAAAARKLSEAGYALVCVSNQPAAAKGTATVGQLLATHRRVVDLLSAEHVQLAESRLCLHHPLGVVPELSGECTCRKPAPGMLMDAAEALKLDLARSWMLGDTDADVVAAHAAGCQAVLIEHPGSAHKRTSGPRPEMLAADLADGVAQLLDRKLL